MVLQAQAILLSFSAVNNMIKAVAIHYRGTVWTMPAPCRHHHVIGNIVRDTRDYVFGDSVQGFITESGHFVDRFEAYKIAKENKQILPGQGKADRLYSEDLW